MIKVLTATYNHYELLPVLYNSLLQQTNKNFQWIVVDDGSTDRTEDRIREYADEQKIEIYYVKKVNGGKSSAINAGLEYIFDDDIVVIIDDDETLFSNAIDTIQLYYKKYTQCFREIGIINFQRYNKTTGRYFANYTPNEDMLVNYSDFTNRGYVMDGYIAYMGYAIKNFRFPVFNGEKYIGPSVLIMLCNEKYGMVYASEGLGESYYMSNGITDQGRRLRLKNPKGMIYRCVLQQNKNFCLRLRLKYSMAGFAYKFFAKLSFGELKKDKIDIWKLNKLMLLPGYALSLYWKCKIAK